jgi:hypothetical protein
MLRAVLDPVPEIPLGVSRFFFRERTASQMLGKWAAAVVAVLDLLHFTPLAGQSGQYQ